MSWNIAIYAEHLVDKDKWEPLTNGWVFGNYKHFMSPEYEYLKSIPLARIDNPTIKSFFTEYTNEVYVKSCSLDEFRSVHEKIVESFNTKLKMVYKSLGLQLEDDCGTFYESSFEEESSSEMVAQLFSMMTFPINKNLVRDLTSDISSVYKSLRMIGLCDVVSELSDKPIRLLFINC